MKIPLVFAASLFAIGCGGNKAAEEAPAKKPVVEVKTALAEASNVELTLLAPATIFPREHANITPRLTGVIRQLKVRKGDVVAAGAVVALLENRDLLAQRDEAAAFLADAQATLEKMRRGTNPTDLERAKGQVETTRAILNQAQRFYDRRKALYEQGAIPQRDLLVSETELSTARTNFEVASRSLTLLDQQSQGQDLRIAEARVEQARSRLATATAQMQFAELRAPFSGVVTEQFQYAGDLGQPNAPIFTLVDLGVVTARAQVPEADVGRVRLGQACQFQGGEQPVAGRVSVINRSVDPQRRTVEVWCEIAKPPASLRAGSFGNAVFQTGLLRDMVLVPVTSLQLEEGTRKGVVMVVDGQNIAHRRVVTVGDLNGEKRVVLAGLVAGETIVVEGGYELPDGSKVTTTRNAKEPAK